MSDDEWKPSPFRKPRKLDLMIVAKFRNGEVSKPYQTGQLRWEPWPFGETEFDIVEWKLA